MQPYAWEQHMLLFILHCGIAIQEVNQITVTSGNTMATQWYTLDYLCSSPARLAQKPYVHDPCWGRVWVSTRPEPIMHQNSPHYAFENATTFTLCSKICPLVPRHYRESESLVSLACACAWFPNVPGNLDTFRARAYNVDVTWTECKLPVLASPHS